MLNASVRGSSAAGRARQAGASTVVQATGSQTRQPVSAPNGGLAGTNGIGRYGNENQRGNGINQSSIQERQ